jgi:uncharacterized membrane protein YkoI
LWGVCYTGAMKKRFLLLVSLSLVPLVPAQAQDNVIRVIRPDGSEAVMELPPADSYAIEKRKAVEPEKPAPVQVIKAPEQEGAAPVTPPVDVPARPAPKTVSIQKPVKAAPPPKPAVKSAPIPPKETGMAKVVTPQPEAVPQDVIVTEKLAKRIALKIAPPAKDMTVLYRTYEGKNVYLVRFKTEEGLFDVLVDMITGDILATKEN